MQVALGVVRPVLFGRLDGFTVESLVGAHAPHMGLAREFFRRRISLVGHVSLRMIHAEIEQERRPGESPLIPHTAESRSRAKEVPRCQVSGAGPRA